MRRIAIGGDVITSIDNQKVTTQFDINKILNHKRPGDVVPVTLYRGYRDGSPPDWRYGVQELHVRIDPRHVTVKITSNSARYHPGDRVTYRITTTDAQGHPVSTQLSLALVDTAVLALKDELNPDIVQAFYAERPLGVSTASDGAVSVDHLQELRGRLLVSLAALAVAFGLCLWQNHTLLHVINKPLEHQTQKQVRAGNGPLGAAYAAQQNTRALAIQLESVVSALAHPGSGASTATRTALQAVSPQLHRTVARLSLPAQGDKPVTLGIGEATGVEHLQEEIEHFRVSFFHFVEQDDAVRAAAQFARQLAFLVMPDVARGGADHARDGVLLHVFRHVNADQVFVGAEDLGCQGARQFGFANSGRA